MILILIFRHGPGPDAAGRAGKSTSSSHSGRFQSELQQPSGGQLCKHCADGKMSISRMVISLKIQQELFLLSTSWNVCFQSKFCSNFTFARVLYIYYIDTITIFIGPNNTRWIIYIFFLILETIFFRIQFLLKPAPQQTTTLRNILLMKVCMHQKYASQVWTSMNRYEGIHASEIWALCRLGIEALPIQ